MTDPFAQAFAELRAIVGREKEYDLKRWRKRWIDRCFGLARVSPLEELQQVDAKAHASLMAYRGEAMALALARSLVLGEGIAAKEMCRPMDGGSEFRLCVCVVRAEPKADPQEARIAKELLDYRDRGIVPPALQAYREREEGRKP